MNTRILLISFLTVAALAAVATPARAGSCVVVGCSDLGTQTPRPAGAPLRVVVAAQHVYPYARGVGRP
jgi:hypothetical protein